MNSCEIDFTDLTVEPGLVAVSIIDATMEGHSALMSVSEFEDLMERIRIDAKGLKKKNRLRMFRGACTGMKSTLQKNPDEPVMLVAFVLAALHNHLDPRVAAPVLSDVDAMIKSQGGCHLIAAYVGDVVAWMINAPSAGAVH